jgi:hypothetical protein
VVAPPIELRKRDRGLWVIVAGLEQIDHWSREAVADRVSPWAGAGIT